MAAPVTRAAAKPSVSRARLILQDPLAFDQATQPVLRTSVELIPESSGGMAREKARELWETLSLAPEVAQDRQSERKRLLARADALARETAVAQAQALQLREQLTKARDEQFNHPIVYAGAAGLLGLGALWWLERRKRLHWQEQGAGLLAQPAIKEFPVDSQMNASVFSLEDSPDFATDFATDLPGAAKQMPVTPPWAQPKNKPSQPLPTEEELVALSLQSQHRSVFVAFKHVLSKMRLRREAPQSMASSHASALNTAAAPVSTSAPSTLMHLDTHDDATQLMYDEQAQQAFEAELLAQQLHLKDPPSYSPEQANIDLLSQTRILPQRGENAMEHLLELRTAVNGLCVLGRPEGALRLLEEHVAADPATCAWAYLQYMQICEQLAQRDEFESMRKRYRLQFNRMAPYWHEPNSNVLGLDGYARATSELCAVWVLGVDPSQATLVTWLIGPLLGRKLVQLPAYHDLFDLYEMLEFSQNADAASTAQTSSAMTALLALDVASQDAAASEASSFQDAEVDFVPTVSLLDLDYEFSSDVTLEQYVVEQAEKSVTVVKPGHFSVDFNVAGTQIGGLFSVPAELEKK